MKSKNNKMENKLTTLQKDEQSQKVVSEND